MEFVADLHLHSKYSRAVSKDMSLQNMALWAHKKGLDILSAADWTHPLWFRELRGELEEKEQGLFGLKLMQDSEVRFLLSVEDSSIYSQNGRVHRIHNLIFSPSFETCEKISAELTKRGCNLNADGRPIIGLSSIQLAELVFSIDKNALIIPCHAWTPWFSLYGSNSGFDSINEGFGKYADQIFGIETGLSSDPFMNWQIEELENRTLLSFSDAHSMAKMGREATVFMSKDNTQVSSKNITYNDIVSTIKQENDAKFKIGYTIEFYPEEGKYHYNGHRNCNFVQNPKQTKETSNICPVCGKPLTIGVMQRVEELAKNTKFPSEITKLNQNNIKWILDKKRVHPPFVRLVPLLEILAQSLSSTVASGRVIGLYNELCKKFQSELDILLKIPVLDIQKEAGEKVAQGIDKVRKGDIVILPGFDGQFGIVKIWDETKVSLKEENMSSQLGIDF